MVAILMSSCAKTPEILDIQEVEVLGMHNDQLKLSSKILLHNPNSFEINLKELDYRIRIHGHQVATGYENRGFILPKKDKAAIQLYTSLDLPEMAAIMPKIMNESETEVELIGDYTFKLLNKYWRKENKKLRTTLDLKHFISQFISASLDNSGIEISNLHPKGLNLDQTQVGLSMRLHNDLPLDYVLESFKIKIYLQNNPDRSLGRMHYTQSKRINSGHTVEIPIDMALSNFNMLSSLPSFFHNNEQGARTFMAGGTVRIKVGKSSFDLPYEQEVSMLAGN